MRRAGKISYLAISVSCLIAASFNTTVFADPVFDEHLKTADKLYKKHEFRKAIKELNIAIEAEPNNFEGYWKRGKCYSETESPEEGMPDFAKALKLNPKHSGIWVSRGLAHVRLKENRRAMDDYKVAIKLDPKNGHAIRLLLVLCLRENDLKNGIKYASLAINNKVSTSENLQRRGYFYALAGDRKNMESDFSSAIERARSRLITAQNEKTTDDSDKIADSKKDLADVYSERGKALVALKDYASAAKDFEQGVALVPDTGKYKCNLGGALLLMHDDKRALDVLTEACKQNSDSASTHSNRGIALERLGQHTEAKKEFELAVQCDPVKSRYLANHARVALALGKTDEATDDYVGLSSLSSARSSRTPDTNINRILEQFDKLIKLNPTDSANFYNRGVINFSQGRYGDAKKDFATFLTLQNDFGESPIYGAILLSITYQNLDKMREAKEVISHAKTVTGSAWTKQLLGLFTEEISFADFMDSHQSGQRELAANCFLGLKYLAEGNKIQAQQKLKWVREHGNPTQDEYLLAISGLNRLSGVKNTANRPSSKSVNQSIREPEISFK